MLKRVAADAARLRAAEYSLQKASTNYNKQAAELSATYLRFGNVNERLGSVVNNTGIEAVWNMSAPDMLAAVERVSDATVATFATQLSKASTSNLRSDLGSTTAFLAEGTQFLEAQTTLAAARKAVTDLGGTPKFARGGYTGPGGVNDVAGIVHAGEVVWSQSDIARASGVGIVEAMRKGSMSYAEDIPAPAPAVSYSPVQSTINFDESALLAELQALRDEVSNLRYEARATAVNTGKAAKHLKEFDDRGLKVKNSETGPLETVTV